MNARSADYLRANKRKARYTADNKLETKEVLRKHGLSTAEMLAVIRTTQEALNFDWDTLPDSFVIKPNRGMGGEGIVLIFNRLKNGNWLSTNKRELSKEDLLAHVRNILDGNFSLLNTPDIVLFEARLTVDPLYKRFSTSGIPDIRVIVYNNVPVMAMLRVPTIKSGGKANLAQGGLGIGVDVTTGMTTHVVMKSWLYEKIIDRHPDTKVQLRGIKVPYWNEIMKTAVLAARVVKLSYCGVDISVDKKRGPVVLELNARPGLGIQIANLSPLRERLERIRGLKVPTPERGITIARELFGGQLEDQVESVTGRQVIGLVESIRLFGKEKIRKNVRAKIDTGADDSSIDIGLARELGYGDAVDAYLNESLPDNLTKEEAHEILPELSKRLKKEHSDITRLSVVSSSHGVSIRMNIKLTVSLAGHSMTIEPNLFDRAHLKYPILIGRRNLSHFLIDSTKLAVKVKPVIEEISGSKKVS